MMLAKRPALGNTGAPSAMMVVTRVVSAPQIMYDWPVIQPGSATTYITSPGRASKATRMVCATPLT